MSHPGRKQVSLRAPGTKPARLAGFVDSGLLSLERPGLAWASGIVGLGLLILAAQRVTLGLHPTYLGRYYALRSLAPFAADSENPVAYRLLTPLVSYLMGLRGSDILVTNWLIATLLLGAAYAWLRREEHAPRWALLIASMLALSLVTLTTLRYGGYSDSLTYAFIFLAWLARRRAPLAAGLFLMAMLNHESAAFMAPWLVAAIALARPRPRRWLVAGVAVGAAVACFAGVRALIARGVPGSEYTLGFYWDPLRLDPLHWYHASGPHRLLGVFSAFNLYWIMPALAMVRAWRHGDRHTVVLVALPIVCAYAQLLVAYDVSRLMTAAFMSILLATEYLVRTGGCGARRWFLWLSLINWLIPQMNVAMGNAVAMGR